MIALKNFVEGEWRSGQGDEQVLYNAVTGEPVASCSSAGIDFAAALHYGREKGNTALRKMTFQQRGLMLKQLAFHLQKHLPEFYELSYKTGATKADSWVDIEGGIGNLFANASLRRKFPDQPFFVDGESHLLGKQGSFMGQHIMLPKEGIAVHINAFNFPVWGMLEKVAVNLLAGMPAIVKPATVSSYVAEAVFRRIIESKILPDGSLQFISGAPGDMLDHVMFQDVVTFTGSAKTGLHLKTHDAIVRHNVPFTMEADSLNCIVLGEDVDSTMPEWDLFIKEVRKEMTLKAGQRCTGVRRILVPAKKLDEVQASLARALAQTVIGSPLNDKVRMGSLAGMQQRQDVYRQVEKLLSESSLVYGSTNGIDVVDADAEQGAFISPLLLRCDTPHQSHSVHQVEAFGPVSTLMPYSDASDAIALSKLGKGSLVSTIVTNNEKIAAEYVWQAGTHHGRMLILNRDCSKENTGHGSPLPLLVHGGPGRAGGGEEMGGIRGVKHYMQRVAVQGSPAMLRAATATHQQGAPGIESNKHPFHHYFEELEAGLQIVTGRRTVTDSDIKQFANLSWDHFYAHTDHTSLEGTLFTAPVAHGYFLMSAAAGLFVPDSKKSPVLLNYGIDELRFVKPVYAGTTIYVRFTCKEKISQELRTEDDIAKGIVKWMVEILDEADELIGIATILTMVKMKLYE